LGPTTDDITRELTAELLGLELIHDEEIMQAIARRFARRNLMMSDRNRRQAQRPKESTVLPNPNGTAPGLYLPPLPLPNSFAGVSSGQRSPHIFLLPGPPRELEPMFAASVVPIIREFAPAHPGFEMWTWKIAGIGESQVEHLVGESLLGLGIELGYCARPGEVDIRTIGSRGQLEEAEKIVLEKLGPHIVSQGDRTLEAVVVDLLTKRQETVATAESCTGGYVAHRITNVPGASAVFLAGFVTYANEAKSRDLGVDAALIREHGAVSHQVAVAMATGALEKSGAHFALATTGIAGPSGGSAEKPVGTVYIALARRDAPAEVERHRFSTDRQTFKDLVSQTALDLLRRAMIGK
ncbi:MAG TPA: nicotinamide-nucleotide amidohydrolase family protein, partial [Chthoniobacteraceae bacterium]